MGLRLYRGAGHTMVHRRADWVVGRVMGFLGGYAVDGDGHVSNG
ncbi:MAG: hypothetical protein PVF04_02785 [Anaerolineae bacterium]